MFGPLISKLSSLDFGKVYHLLQLWRLLLAGRYMSSLPISYKSANITDNVTSFHLLPYIESTPSGNMIADVHGRVHPGNMTIFAPWVGQHWLEQYQEKMPQASLLLSKLQAVFMNACLWIISREHSMVIFNHFAPFYTF